LPWIGKEAIWTVMAELVNERDLLDAAIDILHARLPSTWTVEKISLGGEPVPKDLLIKAVQPGAQATIFVEAKERVTARDVQVLMGGPWGRWRRQMGNQPILLVSRYIAPGVRQRLIEEGVSYLDLTGNVRIDLAYPGVFVSTEGAQRDPASVASARRGVGGAKAGAVVRVLVDVQPPYTGAEVAKAAGVNEGYASRILETLAGEGFIERERFGPVTAVDWPRLMRRRAQAVDLLRGPGVFSFVARHGARALVDELASKKLEPPPTITGSFAAARLAPVAPPGLLVAYASTPRQLGEELELLPAETGSDVVLIKPEDRAVLRGSTPGNGSWWAAPSQVAIDCLAGRGRMPAEGEAVISWMQQAENRWRYPSLDILLRDRA
jgi:hypothetical protein